MSDIERKHTNARMSKIVSHGNLVYLCGQTASGSAHASADITTQTHETLSRVDTLLTEAGSDRERILSATIFLRNIGDFAAMNAVYARHVVDPPPARSTVQVAALPRNARVEIDVIAVIE